MKRTSTIAAGLVLAAQLGVPGAFAGSPDGTKIILDSVFEDPAAAAEAVAAIRKAMNASRTARKAARSDSSAVSPEPGAACLLELEDPACDYQMTPQNFPQLYSAYYCSVHYKVRLAAGGVEVRFRSARDNNDAKKILQGELHRLRLTTPMCSTEKVRALSGKLENQAPSFD